MDPFSARLNQLLVSTYRSITKVEELMLRNLSGHRLSISEMHVLESVGRNHGEGRSITDIAQELDVTLPTVTASIQRLQKKGYVTKARSGDDGRMVVVRLTDAGLRAEIAHRYFHRQMVRAVAATLNEGQKQVLLEALSGLDDFFERQVYALDAAPDAAAKGDGAI
ncbi:MAG: winged helix DNA-binding protein [Clostridiales bacterium]|nr:winged helix DNA-binding protein [Clostridiales bacterium]